MVYVATSIASPKKLKAIAIFSIPAFLLPILYCCYYHRPIDVNVSNNPYWLTWLALLADLSLASEPYADDAAVATAAATTTTTTAAAEGSSSNLSPCRVVLADLVCAAHSALMSHDPPVLGVAGIGTCRSSSGEGKRLVQDVRGHLIDNDRVIRLYSPLTQRALHNNRTNNARAIPCCCRCRRYRRRREYHLEWRFRRRRRWGQRFSSSWKVAPERWQRHRRQ